MNPIKSIAVPISRRGDVRKPRRAGRPQIAPDDGIGGTVGEPRRVADPLNVHSSHRYCVGQRLRLLGGGRAWARAEGWCKVTALMPHEGGAVLYRVRSEAEHYERVVSEDDLTSVHA